MPSARVRSGRRTVYLDTSTLIDAFRGCHPSYQRATDPPTEELAELVARISHDCNLCVSTMHIAELAEGPEDNVRATFRWLDSLDLVWMYSYDKLGAREAEHALQRMVGAPPERDVDPFAPSMLAAFEHWGLGSLSEVLAHRSPLLALAERARARGRAAEHAIIDAMVRRFHFDRHLDPASAAMTDAEKSAATASKRRASLEADGGHAYTRLRGLDLPQFHSRFRALTSPLANFADFVLHEPTALPSVFIAEAFARSFVEVMARRAPGSKKARALRSSLHDYAHLGIGAAYCDVFTCDGLVAECLGSAPTRLGRRAPVVLQGSDMPTFIAALENAAFA